MKIPFDIKYRPNIESGEYKVVTRDGRPARIICWDMKSEDENSIVALVDDGACELGYSFKNTGRFMNSGKDHVVDLFVIAPEPELTEFEKRVYGMITNKFCVKEWSKTLLDLARKQIIKEAEWKAANEGYDIEDAVAFNEGFKTAKELYSRTEGKIAKRLPTIKEWKWLIENCEWKWDDKHKGQVVTARNGNSIFLPAAGYQSDTCLCFVGSYGYYWSSSRNTGDPDLAYYVCFNSGDVGWYRGNRCYGRSVRPVADTPQKGFVDMGNGLYWAEKNEEGYFTYDEAMKLFERGSH